MPLYVAAAVEAGQKLSVGLCCSETVLRAAVCICLYVCGCVCACVCTSSSSAKRIISWSEGDKIMSGNCSDTVLAWLVFSTRIY